MTDNNKLLTLNELQEVQYFSDGQKEFLKDYQFSYILQDYCDVSMQTDDDCGSSITKIAVVKNNGSGNIIDIGTISIKTTTSYSFDGLPTLFRSGVEVEHCISSNNISGFPSHCNETTTNIFNDNRQEVFDKLGILNDAEQWFAEKAFTEEVINCYDTIIKYIEDRFSKHIFCDKCKSLIPSSNWKNYGFFRTYEIQEVGEEAVEVEREYFDMECPICKEHKEVDADEHIELFDSNESKDKVEVSDIDSQNPFGTVEVPDIDSQNQFGGFNSIGPKPCPICGRMFCEHRYQF